MNFKGYAQHPLASREEKPEFESVRADKTRRVGSLHWPLVRQLYMVQKKEKHGKMIKLVFLKSVTHGVFCLFLFFSNTNAAEKL